MVKAFLGAASGSALYLYSNGLPQSDQRTALYLGAMGLLALSAMWALQATVRTARAKARTASYVVRSKVYNRAGTTTSTASWTPLVESTRVYSFGDNEENAAREVVNA
jgi:hypothetical protein